MIELLRHPCLLLSASALPNITILESLTTHTRRYIGRCHTIGSTSAPISSIDSSTSPPSTRKYYLYALHDNQFPAFNISLHLVPDGDPGPNGYNYNRNICLRTFRTGRLIFLIWLLSSPPLTLPSLPFHLRKDMRVRVSFLGLRCIVFFFLPSSLIMFILDRESRWGYFA